jgi:ParB family chromosome partitioning protein
VTLTEPVRPARAPKAPEAVNPRAAEVASDLSEHFDTRVAVSMSRTHGKITIEFAGQDDLDRILAIIGGADCRPIGDLYRQSDKSTKR